MENVFLPRGAPLRDYNFTYKGHLDYIGLNFKQYAQSKGFDLFLSEAISNYDWNTLKAEFGYNDHVVECFLHTWLYCSILQDFFGIFHDPGNRYSHDKFIRNTDSMDENEPKSVFCTFPLNGYLTEWTLRAKLFSFTLAESTHSHLFACFACVYRILALAMHTCGPAHVQLFALVCESLAFAMNKVFCSEPFMLERFRRSWKLPVWKMTDANRMISLGWCPSEVQFIQQNTASLSNMLFLGNMSRLNARDNHDNCNSGNCVAVQNTQVPRHRETCNVYDCKHDIGLLGELKAEALNLLSRGEIPILKLVCADNDSEWHLGLESANDSTRYTAISHVWSDGLGNPNANTLPACQWRFLYETVLEVEERLPLSCVNIWIDTICCPVEPEWAKKLVLSRMRRIYEEAFQVLVLDSELTRTTAKSLDNLEILARSMYSHWTKRLWTLQEGALANRLLVKFQDCILALDDVYNAVLLVVGSTDAGFSTIMRYLGMRQRQYKSMSGGSVVHSGMTTLFETLRGRSVSVATDEPLCLGTLLGLDLETLVECQEGLRMAQMWRLLDKRIPKALLFNDRPTLDVEGLKWAPSTLLGARSGWRLATAAMDRQTGSLLSQGLSINSAGFVMEAVGRPDESLQSFWKLHSAFMIHEMVPAGTMVCQIQDNNRRWYTGVFYSPDFNDNLSKLYAALPTQSKGAATMLDIIFAGSSDAGFGGLFANNDRANGQMPERICLCLFLKLTQSFGNLKYAQRLWPFEMMPQNTDSNEILNFALEITNSFKTQHPVFERYQLFKRHYPSPHDLTNSGEEPVYEQMKKVCDNMISDLKRHVCDELEKSPRIVGLVQSCWGSAEPVDSVTEVVQYMLADNFHINIQILPATQNWIIG